VLYFASNNQTADKRTILIGQSLHHTRYSFIGPVPVQDVNLCLVRPLHTWKLISTSKKCTKNFTSKNLFVITGDRQRGTQALAFGRLTSSFFYQLSVETFFWLKIRQNSFFSFVEDKHNKKITKLRIWSHNFWQSTVSSSALSWALSSTPQHPTSLSHSLSSILKVLGNDIFCAR